MRAVRWKRLNRRSSRCCRTPKISNSAGQGREDYDTITIANHLDYKKWNNFQRKEATTPVFKVIGQFFGLPMLFARTHEFFEKSLVYTIDNGFLSGNITIMKIAKKEGERNKIGLMF